MHDTAIVNPARLAAHEKKSQPPALLNEGQAASLYGIGRRKFHDVRQEPWFVAVCTAVELGPRALRWHRDELLAAAKAAPRVVKLAEPKALADARERAAVCASPSFGWRNGDRRHTSTAPLASEGAP